MAEDKKTKERLDKQNHIDSTIYQVENFVEDYKDKSDILTEEDKNYFKEKIEELKTIREGDLTNADNLITEVNQRLASVGSKVYGTQNNQQGGSNPFGFGQQGFDFTKSGFNGSNFNDIFTGQNGGNQTKTNEKEDVEEV